MHLQLCVMTWLYFTVKVSVIESNHGVKCEYNVCTVKVSVIESSHCVKCEYNVWSKIHNDVVG